MDVSIREALDTGRAALSDSAAGRALSAFYVDPA
jgi:hypothetical protein